MTSKQRSERARSTPVKAYGVVVIAIVATSSAAILIRFALDQAMPPLLIVTARLLIAALALTPLVMRKHQRFLAGLRRKEAILIALAGICLALHFSAWVTSLQYTTVLASVVIVSTGPIWVAILEVIFLHIRLSRLVVLGLMVALAGGAMIGWSPGDAQLETLLEPGTENDTLIGAGLAWLGALSVSVYMLIGRKLRAGLPVIPYVWLVYSIAALCALCAMLVQRTPLLGYSAEGYLVLLAMGLIPQLIGHSSLNYLLEYFPAALVSMFSQLEPIGSALLALVLFRELPPNQQIFGSLTIILGVALASRGEIRQARQGLASGAENAP